VGIARRVAGPSQRGATAIDLYPGPQYAKVLSTAFGSERSYAGKTVSVEAAMLSDAIVACILAIANLTGGFPLKTYEGDETDESRAVVPKHPTYSLLARRPNPEHPPVVFWHLLQTHLLTWGDGFIGKTFYGSGRSRTVGELWPIKPQRVEIERVDGRKIFWLDGRRDKAWTTDEIIHIQGFTLDGLRGLSPIALAREAVGAGLAIDEYSNRFFANSALPVGVLTTDQELDEDAQKRLRRDWSKKHRGLRNAMKVAVLEQGLKWQQITMPMKDLEFVAQQEMTAKKIARMFRVPATRIDAQGSASKGLHYSSAAMDDVQFLKDPIRIWLKRIAQSVMLDRDLFPDGAGLYCQHDTRELLDVDPLTQAQIREIESGHKAWRTPGEFRAEDNLAPNEALDEAALRPPPDPIELAHAQAEAKAAFAPKPGDTVPSS
jgi:HK97 family phage portal protein